MVIRTFKKQRHIKKNLTILFIMLVGILIVAKLSNIVYNKIDKDISSSQKIGETINFEGIIDQENNFPLYTHKITSQNGEKLFLKSSFINLNELKDKLEIVGEIKDIKNDTLIVDVDTIKYPKQGLIIKNNSYYFAKDMLYLDFSEQPKLSAQKTKKEIEIFFENEKIFSIERFLCSRVLRQKDCTQLIEDYGKSQKENFDSYRGYTYYKHGTGLRTMFDGAMFGYIFKDIEEETILNISNIIKIVDKNFVLTNKKDIIKETCEKNLETISQITNSTIQYEDNYKINIIVSGQNNKKNCKITFDTRNQRDITQVQIVDK